MQERPSASVSLMACADNRASHGGANPANCLGKRSRARSPSVTLSLKEVQPVRVQTTSVFLRRSHQIWPWRHPLFCRVRSRRASPYASHRTHRKRLGMLPLQRFGGGATSSRNAVSRRSGTMVGTHVSPLISVRVGWVGVPSKMSADRPAAVTPVTVWKIGLHLKMIWDHGPGF